MVNKLFAIKIFLSVISVVIAFFIGKKYMAAGMADASWLAAMNSLFFIWSISIEERKKLFVCGMLFFLIAYLILYLEVR